MAVLVQITPYTTAYVDFIPLETISELIQRLKDNEGWEFRGSYSIQDAQDAGRVVGENEMVVDGRIYVMNVAIASP